MSDKTFNSWFRIGFWVSWPTLLLIAALTWRHSSVDFTPEERERQTQKIIAQAKTERGMFYVHEPRGGCPKDWEWSPDLFQFEGSKLPGCSLNTGGLPGGVVAVQTDYLRHNEGFTLSLELPKNLQDFYLKKRKDRL